MTKRLEEVVADVRELPADQQDRVADALLKFLSELQDDGWRLACLCLPIGQSVEKRVASLRGGGLSLLIRPEATSFFCDRTAIEGTPHGARDRRGLH
jgi:hypothetical protein